MKVFENIKNQDLLNFDGYFIDIWGVLHQGGILFKGVQESLIFLKNSGKKILLLSNAPRRSKKVESFLSGIGIKKDIHYDFIITSGEAFFSSISSGNLTSNLVFYIGPERDLDVLEDSILRVTKNINENYSTAIITGIEDFSHAKESLKILLKKNIPLFCLNPDLFVVKSDGSLEECAGLIALEYQKMGGQVKYFGKPHKEVYEIAQKTININDKSKILAIGDGTETDILGANQFKISSALCLSGLPSTKINQNGLSSYQKELEQNQQFLPTFFLSTL